MNKPVQILSLSFVLVLVCAAPAMAQTGGGMGAEGFILTKYIGVGLTVIGAAYGIGKLAAAALESMARQPEVASNLQTAMIIAAALIEGFTFFALYICMS